MFNRANALRISNLGLLVSPFPHFNGRCRRTGPGKDYAHLIFFVVVKPPAETSPLPDIYPRKYVLNSSIVKLYSDYFNFGFASFHLTARRYLLSKNSFVGNVYGRRRRCRV